MGDFKLEYDTALRMATKHEGIADDIDGHAKTIATSLDGGEGAEFILNALAALGVAAGQVSQVNNSAGTRLRTTVDVNKGVDDAADDDFRSLEKEIP